MLSTSNRSDGKTNLAWTYLCQVLLLQIQFYEHKWWGLLKTLQISKSDLLKVHEDDLLSLSVFVLAYQSNGFLQMQGHRYSYIMTYYLCYTK